MSQNAGQNVPAISEEELIVLLGELDQPSTRLEALSRLCEFAGPKLYQVGGVMSLDFDPQINSLRDRAAEAVRQALDVDTVSQALDSTDKALQSWALRFWRTGIYEPPSDEINAWLSLMPKVKRLAVQGDENARHIAVEKLIQCKGTEGFLASLIEWETSPYIVEKLARRGDSRGSNDRFNPLLLRLLFHQDENVRKESLQLIGSNSSRVPTLQIAFDMSIYERVVELTYSSSVEERSLAAHALIAVKHLNPDQSRDAFIRLSQDTSSEVRWRVGFGLAGESDREDVKPIVAALLADSSPLVRLMTIAAFGPENFVVELIELAHGSDQEVSERAAGMLKRLVQDGKLGGWGQ